MTALLQHQRLLRVGSSQAAGGPERRLSLLNCPSLPLPLIRPPANLHPRKPALRMRGYPSEFLMKQREIHAA